MRRCGPTLAVFTLSVAATLLVMVLFESTGSLLPRAVVAQDKEFLAVQSEDTPSDPKQAYLELVKQKLQLLTAEEIAEEVRALQQELVERQATKKLRDAVRQLNELIEEHPNSRAANRAQQMLNSEEPLRAPTFDPNAYEHAPARPWKKQGSFENQPTSPRNAPQRRVPDPGDDNG